jgi:uncharacterized membrane protein
MVRFGRWLRHVIASPRAADRAFPGHVLQRIQQAIAASESSHSGEIRFAVETVLPRSYLRRDAPVRQRATMVFAKLRVWDTEDNNGVLIYVNIADRDLEIVADRGIARRVPAEVWQRICDDMRAKFRAGEFEAGSVLGIERVGALLAQHFPLAAGASNPNELPDRPSVL